MAPGTRDDGAMTQRAWDADGAAEEVEHHLRGLRYMGRLACGASSARFTQAS